MLFVNKIWSHLNYYNIAHDITDFVYESVYLFEMNLAQQTFVCSKLIIRRKFEICS